jgi:hypothetical protein
VVVRRLQVVVRRWQVVYLALALLGALLRDKEVELSSVWEGSVTRRILYSALTASITFSSMSEHLTLLCDTA